MSVFPKEAALDGGGAYRKEIKSGINTVLAAP